MIKRKLIEQYILTSILPYFGLALVLLSVALFAQQAVRFIDLIDLSDTSWLVAVKIPLLLLPNILIFSIPAATIIGVIIGLARMGGDSELNAVRSAGIGDGKLLAVPLLFGLVLSLLLLYINFVVTPLAARQIRQIVSQAGLAKLESPVEPRTFYAEMPGKVLFVRDGDKKGGRWERVFIHWHTPDDSVRLVTARAGRIDTLGEQTELVLSDAEVITLPENPSDPGADDKVTTERSSTLRMMDERLEAGRKTLLRNFDERNLNPEEMGFSELLEKTRSSSNDSEGGKYSFVFQRRLALCLAPLVFSLLGGAIGLKTKRGGRGVGTLLATVSLASYYLITVGGENLWKSGFLHTLPSAWLANVLALFFGLFLLWVRTNTLTFKLNTRKKGRPSPSQKMSPPPTRIRFAWGITDRYILYALSWSFLSAFILLLAIFMIFTLFDLLRFIAGQNTTAWLIARYLFFITPYASVILAPMALLVSTLATYAIMARRSEAVAWWAGGQSVYRLAVPGVLFAAALSAGMWLIQEGPLPQANRIQNTLRAQIKGGSTLMATPAGRQWLASPDQRRIYTYLYNDSTDRLSELVVFEFDGEGVFLNNVIIGEGVEWDGEGKMLIQRVRIFSRSGGVITTSTVENYSIKENQNIFKPALNSPAEMSFKQLSDYLKRLRSRGAVDSSSPQQMALERKRADPAAPVILSLIGIPLAFAYGKRNAVVALCVAVLIGISFWGSISAFHLLGARGVLPPAISAWSPAAIFGAVGVYLFTRAKT